MEDKGEEGRRMALFLLGHQMQQNEMGTQTSTMGFAFLVSHALQGSSFFPKFKIYVFFIDIRKRGREREKEILM